MDKQFAENLKNARIKAGLTQAQVAEKIGVAPSSYSFYESGKREPDVLKIRQLADVHAHAVNTGHKKKTPEGANPSGVY